MTFKTSTLPLLNEEMMPFIHREDGSITQSIASSFNINKYFCFFDILPVLCWIPISSMGSTANTIIHFIFTVVYSSSVNSPKIFANRKSSAPFIVFLLSLIYSIFYIIGHVSMFYLTKSGTIKSLPSILHYFDIYSYQEKPHLNNILYVFVAAAIIDIIFIPITLLISDMWFRRAKAALLATFSRPILFIFLIDLSLAVSFSPHKYLLFMPLLFGIICLLVGLCKNSFHYIVAMVFWILFIIGLSAFLVLIASDLIITIELSSIPRWARIVTVCIAGYISSLYLANTFKNQAAAIRIVSKYRPPFFISAFAPFFVIVSSIFFSLCDLTWVSFVGLIAGLVPSFFENKRMALIVPYTFVVNVCTVVTQLFMCCFSSVYSYRSDITLVVPFVLTSVSALFLSNANGNYFRTEDKDMISALVASEKPGNVASSAPVFELPLSTANEHAKSQLSLNVENEQHQDLTNSIEIPSMSENARILPASSAPVILQSPNPIAPRAIFSKVQNIFGVILLLGFYTMASLFASMYPSILTNTILTFSVIFAVCGIFNKIAWRLLMVVTSISAVCQMIVTLLIRYTSFVEIDESIYDLFFIPIDPKNDPIYKALWPVFMLFFVALLIKSIFLSPLRSIVIFCNSIVPILAVLPIIFIENSCFNVSYLILFTVLMHLMKYSPNRGRKAVYIIYGVIAFANLIILILYSFKDFRKLPMTSRTRIILGLPGDGSDDDHIAGLLVLTYFLLIISFTFKFETVEEERVKPRFYDLIVAILSIFPFYFFIIAVFISVIVNHTSSFVYIIILAVMGTVRIFSDKGQIAGNILYYLFLICCLFQTVAALVPSSKEFVDIANLIGPAVSTKLGRGVNIITLLAAYSFSSVTQINYEFNDTLIKIAHFSKRNILVLVQISLAITALEANEILAPVSAVILLFLSLKQSIKRYLAVGLNIIMILLIIYVLYFMMLPFSEVNNVTKYFMLNEVNNIDVAHSFLHLLTCTLLLEFGVNETPGFGNTIFTSYAFPIFAPMIMIFSLLIFDYISAVHTILFGIIIILTLSRQQDYYYLNYAALMYTISTIFFSTVRHSPWFPTHKILDKIFVFERKYVIHRILIFINQFILVTMLRSREFKEVQLRESQRKNYRERRQQIFAEIRAKDEKFIGIYFHSQLHKLQGDFVVLTVEGSYVPYPATKRDYYLINGLAYTADETEITEENETLGKRALKAVTRIFRSATHFIIDLIVWNFMHFTDYNLEPGMSLPAVQKLSAFYDVMIQQYQQTESLDIPQEWMRFAQTIPYSIKQHFRLISRLQIQKDRKNLRYQLLKRYTSMFLRTIFPVLLVLLSFFYPFVQSSSIISFSYILIVYMCISLKIHSYMPYFIISITVMFIRFFVQLPYLDEQLEIFANSPSEQQRSIPILTILGLNNVSDVFTYDAFIFYFAILSVAYLQRHPYTPNRCIDNKFFSRITNRSPYRVNFPVYIFLFDFVGFLILFFSYGVWSKYETNIMSMVSGTSSISSFYVLLLFCYMLFLLAVHISYLSKSAISLFIVSVLFAVASFSVILFAIPHISKKQCWEHTSFRVFLFCRLCSQFFMAFQMNIGFPHEPPQISKGKPLLIIIYEVVLRACPFLFEIVVVMKWIANRTSVTLFNTLILEHVKSKLKQRRATSILFPPRKQRGSCVGVLFLFLMIFLLFFPLLLLSSSDSTTTINPASIIESKFGVAGISSFYEYLTTVEHSQLTDSQQKQIFNMNDSSLVTYYSMSISQLQVLDFPFSSMSEFIVTPDANNIAIDHLKDNESEFIPFGTISLSFKTATTKAKARNVVFNIFGEKLNETEKYNLSELLSNKSTSSTTELRIKNFIPMFIYVPYDNENSYIKGYFYDAIFRLTSTDSSESNGGSDYWHLETVPSDPENTPDFIKDSYKENVTRIVLWSQATPTKLIGSLLTSTGGIIGLYAFIVITIGQFITMWVAGLFTDLWIMRMHNPLKMLNALMAIEAYRLEGDLDKEFELSEMVLENLRSTPRIIQLTDITNANIDQSLVEHRNRFDAHNPFYNENSHRRFSVNYADMAPRFNLNDNIYDINVGDNDNNNNNNANNNNNHQPLSNSSSMDL